ncbi:hypothetical protein DFJ77DRAFT_552486 [Powellomyces hirtus]|nr:hypothetical protein DFJ77DRAFT_515807 [Powellomyces hirtus]KAI8903232.1 hypothetical protein DFJ77DRAFT_552488 [Powellomyces hirtus]KAI8903241.1 hypothetical protein DFJ77DRAFT_552486 [Powellomyces hirtus]
MAPLDKYDKSSLSVQAGLPDSGSVNPRMYIMINHRTLEAHQGCERSSSPATPSEAAP